MTADGPDTSRQFWAWSKSRRILISVTNQALTVDEQPGVAYSFHGATLGTWGRTGGMTTGTALHLQSGTGRFILGGRDHRLSPETPLGAPDAGGYGLAVDINAWVSASEFDVILDLAGLRSRLDVRESAPGTPIRCMLFPNGPSGAPAFTNTRDYMNYFHQPHLTVVVGKWPAAEAIWVMDPNSNALIGSAWPAQVTATPTQYRPPIWLPLAGNPVVWTPEMVVSGPSLPLLTIACVELKSSYAETYMVTERLIRRGKSLRRFSWSGKVQVVRSPADYLVSGADWLTLVGAFGLASFLEEHE
jgi:hypothetical protein